MSHVDVSKEGTNPTLLMPMKVTETNVNLKVRLVILKEENLECLDIFKTQPGHVAKNATSGHQAGNRTHDLANLVLYSAN